MCSSDLVKEKEKRRKRRRQERVSEDGKKDRKDLGATKSIRKKREKGISSMIKSFGKR